MSGTNMPFGMQISPQMAQYIQQMQMQGMPMGGGAQMPMAQAGGQAAPMMGAPLQNMITPQQRAGGTMPPPPAPAAPQQQGGGSGLGALFNNPQVAMQMAQMLKGNMAGGATGQSPLSSQVGPAAGAMSTGALVNHQGGNMGALGALGAAGAPLQGTQIGDWLRTLGAGLGFGIGNG